MVIPKRARRRDSAFFQEAKQQECLYKSSGKGKYFEGKKTNYQDSSKQRVARGGKQIDKHEN